MHVRDVNLEILTGICADLHKPNGRTIADKMLFMVAAMAEMKRDLDVADIWRCLEIASTRALISSASGNVHCRSLR